MTLPVCLRINHLFDGISLERLTVLAFHELCLMISDAERSGNAVLLQSDALQDSYVVADRCIADMTEQQRAKAFRWIATHVCKSPRVKRVV